MSPGDKALLIVQVFATTTIALTLVVYWGQLFTMRKQLEVARTSVKGQNVLAVINFIQEEPTREARETVIKYLERDQVVKWTESERKVASKVCSTYDILSILIKSDVIPLSPFKENWGPSIRMCYEKLDLFIEDMQKPENAGPEYWNDFEWLYDAVK